MKKLILSLIGASLWTVQGMAQQQLPKVVDKNAPVFKIQIFAGKQKIKAGSPLFKGLEGCDSFSDGKLLRYTYGASTNYNEIRKQRTAILDKFPECFIIAMKDGKVVDVNEAIREFLKNKRK